MRFLHAACQREPLQNSPISLLAMLPCGMALGRQVELPTIRQNRAGQNLTLLRRVFMTTNRALIIGTIVIVVVSMGWLAAARSRKASLSEGDAKEQEASGVDAETENLKPVSQDDSPPSGNPESRVENVSDKLRLLSRIRGEIGSPLDTGLFSTGDSELSNSHGGGADPFHAAYELEAGEDRRGRSLPPNPNSENGLLAAQRPERLYTSSLRNAARVLDIGAADLEDLNSYQLADELRELANDLRNAARSFPTEAGRID